MAKCCFARNWIADALRYDQEALRLGADCEEAAFRRWACQMMLGDFERAWQETDGSERRRQTRGETTLNLPLHERRVWNGAPLANQRVLVRCYHGLGDTIQFARFVPKLRSIASEVILQAQGSLLPLLESVPGSNCRVALESSGQTLPEYDVEIESMELPYALRTTLATLPRSIPYLKVSPARVAAAGEELQSAGFRKEALNVGMVWSSGMWNRERNVPLADLSVLSRIPGLQLFSLQRGAEAADGLLARQRCGILPAERESGTPVDSAGFIMNLDLIISVDTMVAHLAGALGKPVWILLPFRADWRWMIDRDDSPWYPTMRLFRQPRPGAWEHVVKRIADALWQVLETKLRGC
jgi:hypothetical protein